MSIENNKAIVRRMYEEVWNMVYLFPNLFLYRDTMKIESGEWLVDQVE